MYIDGTIIIDDKTFNLKSVPELDRVYLMCRFNGIDYKVEMIASDIVNLIQVQYAIENILQLINKDV